MKLIVNIVLIVAMLIMPYPTLAAADDTVDKTICKLAVGYQDVDEIQADLLAAAKREVINELFGEMIVASTAVENFVVTSDQIRTSSSRPRNAVCAVVCHPSEPGMIAVAVADRPASSPSRYSDVLVPSQVSATCRHW